MLSYASRSRPMPRPLIIAHRGASGAAYENSLAAFELARAQGADGVELDIHATSDGAFLVHHDDAVPGLGVLRDHPHEHFATHRLPNGEPIPTLGQVLETLGAMDLFIEVKQLHPRWDARLLQVMRAGPAPERYAVHAFDHRIIARLGRGAPLLRRGALSASYPIDPVTPLVAAGADTLWQESGLIDAALVEAVHASGRRVIAWTVNDDDEARRLAALGVDGLCGNWPDRLRHAVEHRPPAH